MDPVIFDTYLHHLAIADAPWTTAPITAALFSRISWAPAKSDGFVADATGAGAVEVAAASYARQAISGAAANSDGALDRELLASGTFDFGSLEPGFDYDTFVLFVAVTDDTDSWLICALDLATLDNPLWTTDGTDVTVVPNGDGIFQLVQG